MAQANPVFERAIHSASAKLQTAMDRVAKAFRNPDKSWPADAVGPDALAQTSAVIESTARILAAASMGRLDPAQASEMPWADIEDKLRQQAADGYVPLSTAAFAIATAEVTMATITEGADVAGIQLLMKIPTVRKDGILTMYRAAPTPTAVADGQFTIFEPSTERILLISHAAGHGDPGQGAWTTLTSLDLAACRRAGQLFTCPAARTLRRPLQDHLVQHRDDDACVYALHAGLPRLAASACIRRSVDADISVEPLGPYTWLVFARTPAPASVTCSRGRTFPANRITARGVGILRLPPGCRGTIHDWHFFAAGQEAAEAAQTVLPHVVLDVRAALDDADVARRQQLQHFAVDERKLTSPVTSTGDALVDSVLRLSRKSQLTAAADLTNRHWTTPVTLGGAALTLFVVGLLLYVYRDYRFRFLGTERTIRALFAGPDGGRPSPLHQAFSDLDTRVQYTERMIHRFAEALVRNQIRFRPEGPPPSAHRPRLPQFPSLQVDPGTEARNGRRD